MCGTSGVGRSPAPRPPVLSGVRPGPTTHWLWVRAWGPVTNPTARALASWLCALWGRHEGAREGRLLPGCGASGDGRSPTPDHSSFPAYGRGPLPTGCGCGGCGGGDPSRTPHRALLRAGFARCGGGMRVPGGGASCLCVGRPGLGALPPPDHPSFRACGRGPLPTGCGCGRGDPSPTPLRALLRAGFARCGGGMRVPGGGASWLGVGRLGSGAHPRPLVLSGVRPGPTTHWLWVRRPPAWGPVTYPTARTLACRFCALWGKHEGARGGRLLPGCGASWNGRSPTPDLSSARACGRGPLPSGCGCGGCGRGDPSPTPQRALLRAGFARCGGAMRVPGGDASCLGRPGSGALPPPTSRPFGRAAGAHYPLALGAGGAGVGTRHVPTARALASWLCALWGRHEGARGGAQLPGCGASGDGRSATPDLSSFRACGRGPLPTGCGCGGCGRGDPSPTPQRALLRAGVARCGGGMRAPGGGAPLAWVWGLRGRALSHSRPLVLSGVRPGPASHWPWVRGVRAWGPGCPWHLVP